MKTFISALLLLTLVAAASSSISLQVQRHGDQAGHSIFVRYPSGGWDQAVR